MKRVFYCLSTLAATVMLFSSCLGSGSNEYTTSSYAVLTTASTYGQPLFYTYDYPYIVSSPSLTLYPDNDLSGQAYIVNYTFYPDAAENTAENFKKNGYYTVTIGDYLKLNTFRCAYYPSAEPEIDAPLENEIKTTSPATVWTVINGLLFLQVNYKYIKDQKSEWYLYTNSSAEPKFDTNKGANIYDIYLRGKFGTTTSSGQEQSAEMMAFDTKSFLNTLNSRENNAKRTKFYLRLNYPAASEEDKEVLVWKPDNSNLMELRVVSEE